MSKKKKLKREFSKLVEKNKFRKVRNFLEENPEFLDKKLDDDSSTALHLAARKGHTETVLVLVKSGCDIGKRDVKNRLPLHYACKYLIRKFSSDACSDLIPSLKGSLTETELKKRDSKGVSCLELLEIVDFKFKEKKRKAEKRAELNAAILSQVVKEEPSEEDKWREKLMLEAQDDVSDFYGSKYYPESGNTFDEYIEETGETYDEWTDRIYKEFVRKREQRRRHEREIEEKSKARKPETDESAFKINEKQLKLKGPPVKKESEKRYQRFLENFLDESSSQRIRVDDFPFTETTSLDKIVDCLFGNLSESSDPDHAKKFIRDQLRIWHPDKFFAKYESRIPDEEKTGVKEIVNHVSRSLIEHGRK